MKTVKTEQRATVILEGWLNEKRGKNLSINTVIEPTKITCECGETLAYRAFYEAGDEIAIVGVCELCGNDDNSENDVLEIL
jgi:hypothetical protein